MAPSLHGSSRVLEYYGSGGGGGGGVVVISSTPIKESILIVLRHFTTQIILRRFVKGLLKMEGGGEVEYMDSYIQLRFRSICLGHVAELIRMPAQDRIQTDKQRWVFHFDVPIDRLAQTTHFDNPFMHTGRSVSPNLRDSQV